MWLDFSIDTEERELISKKLHKCITEAIGTCAEKYNLIVDIDRDAFVSLGRLANAVHKAGGQLYVIIDEYDRFANKLMFENPEIYEAIVAGKTGVLGSSPIRSFFEALKTLTATHGLCSFATGLTPLALANASGANNRVDLSNNKFFADVCGFTDADIKRGLSLIDHLSDEQRERALVMMREYYNGYLFEGGTPLYNSTLCLYFLDQLVMEPGLVNMLQKMTDEDRLAAMVDINVSVSENLIRFLQRMPGGPEAIFELVSAGDKPVTNVTLLPSLRLSGLLSPKYNKEQRNRVFSLMYNQGVVTRTKHPKEVKLPNQVAQMHLLKQLAPVGDTSLEDAIANPTLQNWQEIVYSAFDSFEVAQLMSNDTPEADVQGVIGASVLASLHGCGYIKFESFLKGVGRSDLIVLDKNNNGVLLEIGRLRPKHLLFADVDLDLLAPTSSDAKAMSRELVIAENSGTLKDIKLRSKVERASTVGEFVSKKCDQALGYVESAKAKYNLCQLKAFAVISVGDRFIVEECDDGDERDNKND